MLQRLLMRLFVAIAAVVSIGGFLWMTFAPPPGLKASRDGVPYFSPPVQHPVSGEAVPLEKLVRHYKGEK
ncbi:MAG: hypothetical protein RBS28_02355 [Rhodocyclaceae bacterium]|jgi:hypothetical protein|nr:hypothetical protein [Rhodocyclaceae bacterium]